MNNPIHREASPDIKEEIEDDSYLDDKVLVSETTITIDSTEFNVINDNTIMDIDIKRELSLSDPNLYNTTIDDNIKIGSDVGDIKVKFNNNLLFCNNCNEYCEEYCTKCGMLICILNGSDLDNQVRKELPTDILEIKESLFGSTGVFALKTVPKGVKFGPFTGFSSTESSWRLKEGKFVVGNDKSEFLNWMQYVNSARSVSDQNLCVFQYEDDLYYSSVCEIQEGEELLVYFGEKYEESLNNGVEMDFIPHIETDAKNVFACTHCCFGFSLKVYLVEHKSICTNGTVGNFEDLAQCSFCKIYLEKKEYLEHHKIHCCKRNARPCVLPTLDDQTLEENNLSPATDKRRRMKLRQCKYIDNPKNHTKRRKVAKIFRCGICYKRFKMKEFLKLHVENIHIAIKPKHSVCGYLNANFKNTDKRIADSHRKSLQFKCLKCKFQTSSKYSLKSHIKSKHLKEFNYNCKECEYKTNARRSLLRHIKTKHLEEYDYDCEKCEYKTNIKSNLEAHIKNKHLKKYDYNCMECEFKTNCKSYLEKHIKTKHLKEYDYNCVECEFKTIAKSKLERHMKTKHLKEYDYNCMDCEFKTNAKFDLETHIKNRHLKKYDYNCIKCEYKTNKKSSLEIHIKSKHLKEYDYNCIKCEYKTNSKSNLETHVKNKHLKEYHFNCLKCEYKTNRKSVLQTHLKNKHLKEYDYNCMECEYKTNSKSKLEAHIKSKHLKEYDYNCMECEYKTNSKSNLTAHIKNIHLKEYNYNCMECEYKTNSKYNLEIHIKNKHRKEYNYNCEKCEYKTSSKSNLETHVKIKHLKESHHK